MTAPVRPELPPLTLTWVDSRLLDGEHVIRSEVLREGVTAEMRRLTIRRQGSATRELVLRTVVGVAHAEEWLTREAGALRMLAAADGVPAPELVAVDAKGVACAHPSLLMTLRPGRAVYGDAGLEERVPLLARQLVAIHGLRPERRPPVFTTLTTAESVVVPAGADAGVWAGAREVLRGPVPAYEGRYLHRDFHPGNVLFDGPRITGVVDWAQPSWGPADLDVAHLCTTLALLHGPPWAARVAEAYEEAGGVLAGSAGARWYWRLRDALAVSEELELFARPWREAGRTELTPGVVAGRLDAYVTGLMEERG
ncbi:phosphotransferase family protein [Streptomyces sp. NPDC060194]|uniref:phosphotransferase family protein n=1 Tax=Streptomyces sp. NPDC060194 TaxID=3347069 RepID=UPI00364B975C